jgi:hypothetical protein
MSADKAKVNLVMTFSPFADNTRHFGTNRQYVFHVNSSMGYGMAQTETKVICTFTSDTAAQCWVGANGYVKGDASAAAGLASTDGKIKVFAGLRADPFFFNLGGFKEAVGFVIANAATLPGLVDASGKCFNLSGTIRASIVARLHGAGANTCTGDGTTTVDCGTPADAFAAANVLAISMEIDTTLLTGGGPLLSVWASTHAAP